MTKVSGRSGHLRRLVSGALTTAATAGMMAVAPVAPVQAADHKALDLMKFYWHCYVLMWTDPAAQFAECGTSFPHEWKMTGPGQNGGSGNGNRPPRPPVDECDGPISGAYAAPNGRLAPAEIVRAQYNDCPTQCPTAFETMPGTDLQSQYLLAAARLDALSALVTLAGYDPCNPDPCQVPASFTYAPPVGQTLAASWQDDGLPPAMVMQAVLCD